MAVDPTFYSYCAVRNKVAFQPNTSTNDHVVHQLAQRIFTAYAGKIGQMPKMPPLFAGFIESTRFNAAADIWDGKAFIRVHSAVPTILANLFTACFSHPGALSSGARILRSNEALTTSEDAVVDFLFNDGRLIDHPSLVVERTIDMALACCDFMFFHEFIHIRNGHLDLFRNAGGLFAMEELDRQPSKGLTALDRRAFEWDADRQAHLIGGHAAILRILRRPPSECSSDQVTEVFRLYHLALYLMYKFMEQCEPKEVEERIHPSPIARMMWFIQNRAALAKLLGINNPPIEFTHGIILAGELAWAAVLGLEEVRFDDVGRKMDREAETLVGLMKHWAIIRERLVPLNRGTTDLSLPHN